MKPIIITGRVINLNEAARKRNPQLYAALGGLSSSKRECDSLPALEQNPQRKRKVQGKVVVIVTLVAFRRRLLDDDNLVASFKHLRDCICNRIGCNDNDKRIKFEYGQIITTGHVGTLVRIETV